MVAVGALVMTGCDAKVLDNVVETLTNEGTTNRLAGCWVSETDAGTGKVTTKFEFTQQKDDKKKFDVVNTVTTPDGNGGTTDAKATKLLTLNESDDDKFTLTDKNIDGSLTENSSDGAFDIDGGMLVLKDGAGKETGRYSTCK